MFIFVKAPMKQIYLHIGDRVKHQSLGHGIVIAVSEDLCTARFGTKEANFRIPEAFVRGYLSSEDARIGVDDVEAPPVPVEEIQSKVKDSSDEKSGKGCAIASFIMIFAFILFPISAFFFYIYSQEGEKDFLWYAILCIVCFIVMIPITIWIVKKEISFPPRDGASGTSSSGLDARTELMAGILGSEIINRKIEKEKEAAEKRRYDTLYWQESVRDENNH